MCPVLVENSVLEPARGQLGDTLLRGFNGSLPRVQVRQADLWLPQLQNLPNEQVVLGVKVNGIGHNQTIILKLDAVCLLLGFAFADPPSGSKGFQIVDTVFKTILVCARRIQSSRCAHAGDKGGRRKSHSGQGHFCTCSKVWSPMNLSSSKILAMPSHRQETLGTVLSLL